MILTKSQIVDVIDWRGTEVQVPEWGGSVMLRTVTAGEREEYETFVIKAKDPKTGLLNTANLRAAFLAMCLCDAEGNRLFSHAEVAEIGKKSAAVIERLFDVAQRHNKLLADDIKELEGN